MANFDSLGDRMKMYESHYNQSLIKFLPAFARLDGKAFHSFTRDLKRPYDQDLSYLMRELTQFLVSETGAIIGYTQSDEITLSWYYPEYQSQMYFDGKINKLNSILASMATLKFRELCAEFLPEKQKEFALFDCRTWNVPNIVEGANVFVWREQDATRNSIQMAARSVFSHRECQNKSCPELQEMLFKKGTNWNDYPDYFKKGSYIRKNGEIYLPIITKIKNRHEVIYLDAEPIIEESKSE